MDSATFSQSDYLSILSQAPAERIKPFVNDLIPELGEIEVIANRTGLVMLPYTDSVKGAVFHLGEVLVAEAHIRLGGVSKSNGGTEGYGSVLGRDLQQALAVALLDGALQHTTGEIGAETIQKIENFVQAEAEEQQAAQEELLKQVEATRVEMETF